MLWPDALSYYRYVPEVDLVPKKRSLSPIQLIIISFLVIIILGTALLMLPFATRDGHIAFIDALFTATSATCVTGLVIFDTYTKFTLFGQIVLLCLIQIGGLGFITIAMVVAMMSGRRIGLKSRTYLAEAVSSAQLGGVLLYSKMIVVTTLLFEGVGALLLSFRFIPMFGAAEGIWCGIFHSISAFCNAGFDILGRITPGGSLTPFASDAYVNGIITLLIIVGGIGFFVIADLRENKFHWKKYRLHTKIMLTATACLLVFPTILFMITEYNGAYAGMSFGDKLMAAFFQTVTTRTAGFNTTDHTAYSSAGYALSIFLMMIGAGAGSTGGGLKVTTFVVIVLSVRAYMTGTEDANVYGRRLDRETMRRVFCGTAFYIGMMLIGAYVIMLFQKAEMSSALYEAASAIGTVGLSSGMTAGLLPIPKVTVMIMMFAGRVGSMSLAMSVARPGKLYKVRLPEEKIIAG